MAPSKKVLAKVVHFYKGVELMGSKGSATASKNIEVEVTPLGVKVTSKNSRRTIIVPWANITGCELYFEEPNAEG